MSSPIDTEAAYSSGSPSTAQRETLDTIRHITIRQILTATHVQTCFKVNDRETGFVQVVANVYDASFTRERADFRLDDGTGRIRATKWDVIDEDGEREFVDSILERFQYVRVIGTIGEYRGLHYLKIIKITFVEDPHEICHHLLRVMAEYLMMQRGPPDRTVAQLVKPTTQRAESFSLHSLERSLPSVIPHDTSDAKSSIQEPPRISCNQSSRTSPRERPVTPLQRTAEMFTPLRHDATELPDESPISVRIIGRESSKKGYRIGVNSSSMEPSRASVSPSPVTRRRRPSSRPSLAPGRLLKSSANQATTSTAEVSHYQASPQFISPAGPIPPGTSGHHGARGQVPAQRRIIPQLPNDFASQTPVQTRGPTRMTTRLKRDPYSHLSNLQRDIILTIRNTLLEVEGADLERGVRINVIVDSIARRSPGFDRNSFGEAFVSLVEEGYIYSTIDDEHFACTT